MSKQIPMGKIVDATLSGIKKSQQQYKKWSGGHLWLLNAPEYLITINVASKISEIGGPQFITLENGSKSLLEDAGARGKGRLPNDIRERGRVDILLWWGNDRPRAVIEIKNYIYDYKKYEDDIKRIKHFLKRNSDQSSLQFGLFGYCDFADNGKQKSARQKIEDKNDRIEKQINDILGEGFQVIPKRTNIYEIEESDWSWCASCMLIRNRIA